MALISLLLLFLMVVGFLQFVSTVRGLYALYGRRFADAQRFAGYALLAALVVYPLVLFGIYFAQLHWGPEGAAMSPSESLTRTISATMTFGVVGVFSLPLAALTWIVSGVARWRSERSESRPRT